MHPAPSVILFSVLSGLGFGYMAYLGLGFVHLYGWSAFFGWGLGYGLAITGLLAATFHLGNPKRAWRAFSQWRSSWLSREAWASVASLFFCAPAALSDWLGLGLWRGFGFIGGVLALVTVFTTSMIYAQIRAVPRWNHWITPVMFLTFALAGGGVLAGPSYARIWLPILGVVVLWAWKIGDKQFELRAQTLGTATGLGTIGEVTVFEQAHTAGNYLLREMIYVVGRKHVEKLQLIALVAAVGLPLILLLFVPGIWATVIAASSYVMGALAARWLFFAQAEHVVGLYYGKR